MRLSLVDLRRLLVNEVLGLVNDSGGRLLEEVVAALLLLLVEAEVLVEG